MRSNGWNFAGPRAPRWLLAIAAPAAIQLALAGSALADTYTVDATSDDPDAAIDGSCDDGAGSCTLRAAIQESNASAAIDDRIEFDPSVFDGTPGPTTIALASALPVIADTLELDGAGCGGVGNPHPCVEVRGGGGFDGLAFAAGSDGSTLRGLAVAQMRVGIRVSGPPDSTVSVAIGDGDPAGANVISDNSADAIRVTRVDGVEIKRNTGSGNADQFIDLENPAGPGNSSSTGAAEGLQPPTVNGVASNSISGTGDPNATIRVFAKSTAGAGELGQQLATTTSSGSGAWSAGFAAQPDGQRLAATQTVAGPLGSRQTSEPIQAQIQAAQIAQIADFAPPDVVFTRVPGARVKSKKRMRRVIYEFAAAVLTPLSAEVRFECSLDGAPFLPCVSRESTKVRRGPHSFQVRARDALGNAGSAARHTFKVVRKKKQRKKR